MFAVSSDDKLEASRLAGGQISIWEKSLALRVHLQKSIDLANTLPVLDDSRSQSSSKKRKSISNNGGDSDSNSSKLASSTCETISDLLYTLDPSKKVKLNSSDPEAVWNSIIEVQDNLKQNKWEPVLNKWYSRVNFGSEKNRAQLKVFNKSIFSQIDEIISDEKVKIQKSRIAASESPRKGFVASVDGEQSKDYDLEVYDDRAFYFLLLQSFLQSSNYDSSQNDRIAHLKKIKSKKKDVDRKASKGRKIRYVVHPKLQNFMFPIPDKPTTFDRDALFQSLFQ
jgi:protein AATF/BFR2